MRPQRSVVGFLSRLPVILSAVSKSTTRAVWQLFERIATIIWNGLRAVGDFIVSIAKWLWATYCKLEFSVVQITVNLLLAFWSIRLLLALVAVAVSLAYFKLWIFLLIYLGVIAAAVFLYFKMDAEDEARATTEQEPLKNWIASVLRWVFRIAISFAPIIGFLIFGGVDISTVKNIVTTARDAAQVPTSDSNQKSVQNARSQKSTKSPVQVSAASGPKAEANLGPPQIRVGDSYVFESRNVTQPGLSYTAERVVVGINGDKVSTTMRILTNGYTWKIDFDSHWNVISSRSQSGEGSDHSPPIRYFDFPLRTGKKWIASSTERNIKTGKTRLHKISGTIGEWEEITVPAGRFRGLRVTLNTEFEDENGLVSAEDVSWYVPEVKRTVLSRIKSLNRGTQERREQEIVLVSYKANQ